MRRNDVVDTGALRHRVHDVHCFPDYTGLIEAGGFWCGRRFRFGKNCATVRRTFPTCLGCVAMEGR